MPRIRPKNAAEWTLLGLTGTKGLEAMTRTALANESLRRGEAYDRRADRADQRAAGQDERDAAAAERDRQAHELEIERVKRKQAEEDAEKLRKEQEASAAREATRWGIERVRRDIEAQRRSMGGNADLDPKTKELLGRAEKLADRLSPDAQALLLGEVEELATNERMTRAREQATDRLADTIKDLSSAEFDVGPLIEPLQSWSEIILAAETPAQLAQAVQGAAQDASKARAEVTAEHVKADKKKATIASIQDLYKGDPAKVEKSAFLTRSVQFNGLDPDKAMEMAVNDKFGLKPLTAQEIAARGGPKAALFGTPQGRQAYAWMIGEVRTQALAELKQVLGPDASTEQRDKKLAEIMDRDLALKLAQNGWYAPDPVQNEQIPSQAMPEAAGRGGPPGMTQFPGQDVRPPAVPLEQVREAMGSKPAEAAKDDPEATAKAVALEIKARAKAEGWSHEKSVAELKAALKDMGLIDG